MKQIYLVNVVVVVVVGKFFLLFFRRTPSYFLRFLLCRFYSWMQKMRQISFPWNSKIRRGIIRKKNGKLHFSCCNFFGAVFKLFTFLFWLTVDWENLNAWFFSAWDFGHGVCCLSNEIDLSENSLRKKCKQKHLQRDKWAKKCGV